MAWREGLAYGLLGLPLAFAALPLYVVLPNHYARHLGLPLATVGLLLLAVRLMDALTEPLLGRLSDLLYARSVRAVLWAAAGCALVQLLGLSGLFFPPAGGLAAQVLWVLCVLLLTSLAHSQLVIAHQAWGVRLGGSDVQRSRIVAWREGLGLLGVVLASALSVAWGPTAMLLAFALALLLGWLGLWQAPRPTPAQPGRPERRGLRALWQPCRVPAFRRLLAVYLCNGIAGAVPASLMLFFAQDRLGASPQQTALFLVVYFVSGAVSMPAWLRLVRHLGLQQTWLVGMVLAVACFGWTAGLGRGEVLAFAVICGLSGVAMGADLALPGALLACLIGQQGAQGRQDGAYLGWWNLATKLNLALAAGAVLPLLQWGGYVPGSQDPLALQRLGWAYALLPCALKLLAAALLHVLIIRRSPAHTPLQGVAP
jgi:Na+/melibiose symporter-like transporter